MALFCDSALRLEENLLKTPDLEKFAMSVVEGFLETMIWGPKGQGSFFLFSSNRFQLYLILFVYLATEYFPRLLQIIEVYPNVQKTFIEKCRKVYFCFEKNSRENFKIKKLN